MEPLATGCRHPRRLAVVASVLVVAAILAGLVAARTGRGGDPPPAPPGVSLFAGDTVPESPAAEDRRAVEVGVRVRFAAGGAVTALRTYRGERGAGARTGHLWSADGRLLAEVAFADGPAGWQTAALAAPVGAAAGSEYVVSYFAPEGAYPADADYFADRSAGAGAVTAPAGGNGVFRYGDRPGFPTDTWRSTNYYADLVFDTGDRTPPPAGLPPAPRTTAPTPTATGPAPGAGAAAPPPPGFPGPGDTGVPPGRTPREVQGDYHVTEDGAVVEDLLIRGSLYIEADDVTVRYVEARCTGAYWIVKDLGHRTTITDSTFTVDRSRPGAYCQYGITAGDDATLRRNEVAYTPVGMTFPGRSATVEDNWVHDQVAYPGHDDHVDGVLLSGGGPGPYVFRHNTVSVPGTQTAALAFFDDFGPLRDVVADRNFLEGGGYTVYGGGPGSTRVRITGNVFSRSVFPTGGLHGPVTGFDRTGSGNEWSGNVWAGSGRPVEP